MTDPSAADVLLFAVEARAFEASLLELRLFLSLTESKFTPLTRRKSFPFRLIRKCLFPKKPAQVQTMMLGQQARNHAKKTKNAIWNGRFWPKELEDPPPPPPACFLQTLLFVFVSVLTRFSVPTGKRTQTRWSSRPRSPFPVRLACSEVVFPSARPKQTC